VQPIVIYDSATVLTTHNSLTDPDQTICLAEYSRYATQWTYMQSWSGILTAGRTVLYTTAPLQQWQPDRHVSTYLIFTYPHWYNNHRYQHYLLHIYSQVANPQSCRPLLHEGNDNRSCVIPSHAEDPRHTTWPRRQNAGNNSWPRLRTAHPTIQNYYLITTISHIYNTCNLLYVTHIYWYMH
jgi:hypothetical protein